MLCFFVVFIKSFAQDFKNETFALHPRIGGIYNLHLPNFNSFQGAADCGNFTKGSGWGYSFSVTGEKFYWENYFLGIGLSYTS